MKLLLLILTTLIIFPLQTRVAADPGVRVLFFYLDTCKWCKQMEEVISNDPVKPILDKYTEVIRIDFAGNAIIPEFNKREKELVKKFGVNNVPTFIFLGPDENTIIRFKGALFRDDFRDILCEYVADTKDTLCTGNDS